MSSMNAFALLDASDDEEEKKVVTTTKKQPAKKAGNKSTSNNKKSEVMEASKKPAHDREASKGKNSRSGRGAAGGRGNGREYERRSGTGRGKEVSKGGAGGRNWGNDKEAASDKNNATGDKTDGDDDAEDKEPEEPEEPQISYEEYMASKAEMSGEGFTALKGKTVENEFTGGKSSGGVIDELFLKFDGGKLNKEGGKANLKKKGLTVGEKKAKQVLVANFKIKDPEKPEREQRSERPERRTGGKEGGRGGGGGGRSNNDRFDKPARKGPGGAVNVNDVTAFPSLG